jgi:hypothetical protein
VARRETGNQILGDPPDIGRESNRAVWSVNPEPERIVSIVTDAKWDKLHRAESHHTSREQEFPIRNLLGALTPSITGRFCDINWNSVLSREHSRASHVVNMSMSNEYRTESVSGHAKAI